LRSPLRRRVASSRPPLGTILPGVTESVTTLAIREGLTVSEEKYVFDEWRADAQSGDSARGGIFGGLAHGSLHRQGSSSTRGDHWSLCRHAGLIAARTAVMTVVAAIDADMRRMARASAACQIPGVDQRTALDFVAAVDDPSRIRRSRDIGAYLGLVPGRYQSGEVDYVGSISKCGDRRVP
jgi:hypothetical protein